MFETQLIDDLGDLVALAPALEQLYEECAGHIFMHPAFFVPWSVHAVAAGLRPRCVALRHKGELVAFAPLFHKPGRFGIDGGRISPPLNGSTPPFGLLISTSSDVATVGREIARAVAATRWLVQTFPHDLDKSGFGDGYAPWFEAAGCTVHRTERPGYRRVVCRGIRYGDYLKSLSKNTRSNIRKLARNLAQECEISRHHGDRFEDNFDEIEKIVRRSWKFETEVRSGRLEAFRAVAKSMNERGLLRTWLVWRDGRAICHLVEFMDGRGGGHSFHSAYDGEFAHLGVASAILNEAIRDAFEMGLETYDLWGYLPNLQRIANACRPCYHTRIERRGLRSRLRRVAREQMTRRARAGAR